MEGTQLPYVYGMQTGALPGPPVMPVASQNVNMVIERTEDVNVDAKAKLILNTLGLIPNATNARFFSDLNIEHLQQSVVDLVRQLTGYRIDKQSEHDLVLIMRSFYMRNQDAPLASLNAAVVKEAVKIIADNLELHAVAQASDSRFSQVIDRPISTNVAGTRLYERP